MKDKQRWILRLHFCVCIRVFVHDLPAVGEAELISGLRHRWRTISGQQTCADHCLIRRYRTHTIHSYTHTHTRLAKYVRAACTIHAYTHLNWDSSGSEEEVHFLFGSYFHIMFYKFPPVLSVVVYWSHVSLQAPTFPEGMCI